MERDFLIARREIRQRRTCPSPDLTGKLVRLPIFKSVLALQKIGSLAKVRGEGVLLLPLE